MEVFFFAFAYFNFLNFTRSTPDISQDHPLLSNSILFLLLLSFLFHIAILYLSAFPDRSFHKKRNELLAFSCFILPIFVLIAYFSPQDFVKHEAAFNRWNEKPPPKSQELDPKDGNGEGEEQQEKEEEHNRNGLPLGDRNEKFPSEIQKGDSPEVDPKQQEQDKAQEQQKEKQDKDQKQELPEQNESEKEKQNNRNNDQNIPQPGQPDPFDQPYQPDSNSGSSGNRSGGQDGPGPKLEGVPAEQWENYNNSQADKGGQSDSQGGGGQNGKQRAIMIIASQINPVYAAEAYLGTFSQEGLSRTAFDQEPLNEISNLRLIETWQDKIGSRDDKRSIEPMFFLSTLKKRVLAYRPYRIQPTVQTKRYHPFDLSYHVQSRISTSLPEDWLLVREMTDEQKQKMQRYLEVDLPEPIKQKFIKHLKKARRIYQKKKKQQSGNSNEKYFEKADAILRGFSNHRYELGFDEKVDMNKLSDFLDKTKKGDCTEFSHTTAILARLVGIPSRVVIGYLSSKDLQTPAHRGAIYHLQKKIDHLKKYDRKNLYLITTSHHHAWVQLWLPSFGWIDFETTSYAIPPEPSMDPNNMDVVIPLIEEDIVRPSFVFPWRLVLTFFIELLAGLVNLLYMYRYGRQIYYWLISKTKRSDEKLYIASLRTRLLFRLATEGYPLKSPYKTTLEYITEDLKKLKGAPLEEFAEIYTMLRFRENYSQEGEKKQKLQQFQQLFRQCMPTLRKRGLKALIVRIFSLRSLYIK